MEYKEKQIWKDAKSEDNMNKHRPTSEKRESTEIIFSLDNTVVSFLPVLVNQLYI